MKRHPIIGLVVAVSIGVAVVAGSQGTGAQQPAPTPPWVTTVPCDPSAGLGPDALCPTAVPPATPGPPMRPPGVPEPTPGVQSPLPAVETITVVVPPGESTTVRVRLERGEATVELVNQSDVPVEATVGRFLGLSVPAGRIFQVVERAGAHPVRCGPPLRPTDPCFALELSTRLVFTLARPLFTLGLTVDRATYAPGEIILFRVSLTYTGETPATVRIAMAPTVTIAEAEEIIIPLPTIRVRSDAPQTFQPGETRTETLTWNQRDVRLRPVPAGDFTATATFTAAPPNPEDRTSDSRLYNAASEPVRFTIAGDVPRTPPPAAAQSVTVQPGETAEVARETAGGPLRVGARYSGIIGRVPVTNRSDQVATVTDDGRTITISVPAAFTVRATVERYARAGNQTVSPCPADPQFPHVAACDIPSQDARSPIAVSFTATPGTTPSPPTLSDRIVIEPGETVTLARPDAEGTITMVNESRVAATVTVPGLVLAAPPGFGLGIVSTTRAVTTPCITPVSLDIVCLGPSPGDIRVVFRVPAQETPLVPGCNNAAVHFGTAFSLTARDLYLWRIRPHTAVDAVWKHDAATGSWLGFSPIPNAPNSLRDLNRLDAIFICVRAPATLFQPPLP